MGLSKEFSMILSLFMNELLAKNYKETTIASYESDVTSFLTFATETLEVTQIEAVALPHLFSYIIHLQTEKKSSATVARHIASLKNFFGFLRTASLIKEDISIHVQSPAIKRRPKKVLTTIEMAALLQVPDRSTILGKRDIAIMELMYATGIRITEMVNLKIKDVYLEMGYVRCGSPDRLVPFGDRVIWELKTYIADSRPKLAKTAEYSEEDILFLNFKGTPMSRPGYWKVIKKIGNTIGIDLYPEMIRDSYASHMLQRGAPPEALQLMLGVKDYSFVGLYDKAPSNLKKVFRDSHPNP